MSILKNAIAEAREVKALALANAKMALEETFQPTIQRMISSKIAEEEGEDEVDIDINLGDDSEPNIGFGGEDEMETEPPVDDEEEFEPEVEEAFDEYGEDELEEEINRIMSEMDGEDEEDYLGEGDEEDWSDPIQTVDEEFDMEDEEEFTESEIREVLDEMDGMEDEEDYLGEIDDLDGMGDELEEADGAYDSNVSVRRTNTESIRRENGKLRKDLNEAYRAITTLKTAINEVNLLNARLMYTQKVFQNFDLNKSQKVKVLEAFDRANSIREIKSKYQDMLSLLNGRKETPRRVTEGAASKPIKQLAPEKKALNESVIRFQKLAGLRNAYD